MTQVTGAIITLCFIAMTLKDGAGFLSGNGYGGHDGQHEAGDQNGDGQHDSLHFDAKGDIKVRTFQGISCLKTVIIRRPMALASKRPT